MKKILLAAVLLFLSLSSNAQFFLGRLQDQIYSQFHNEGLPKKVGKHAEAQKYRQEYMDIMGITSFKDSLGLSQYKGNDEGLALIKKGNTDEAAFLTVLNQNNFQEQLEWKNGPGFIEVLKEYTARNGCIPKITSVSHGWISEDRPGEGHGLTGNKGHNGLFATEATMPSGLKKFGARSVEKDLAEAMDSGDIQFCGRCVIQFYSCNISTKFAKTLALTSGCQTVLATGMNSPFFQEDSRKIYSGAHYWKSAAAIWSERHTDAQRANNERLASWYRATPIKNSQNEIVRYVEENLGELYIAL